MSQLLQQLQELIQNNGIGGYFSAAGMVIFYITGFVSVWLVIGMFIYSLFSKNWAVWKKWKYMGYFFLVGIGLLLIGVIVTTLLA